MSVLATRRLFEFDITAYRFRSLIFAFPNKGIKLIKTILLILLGLFFILNGINHLYNTHILAEYAHRRGLVSPQLMVRISGIALIFGGLSLMTGFLKIYGIIGLSIFLVVSALTIHQFWREAEREMWMLEVTHFAKNAALLTELIYIATG